MKISTKVVVRVAILAAISIILGKYLSIKIGDNIRLSFENLTIIMAGYMYGPIVGAMCGIVADIVGCFCVGYGINPIITLGAACIGLMAGMFNSLALSVFTAHILGSMIIKTIGLHVFLSTRFEVLVWRVPIYIVIGILEYIIIRILIDHRAFKY